MTGEMGGMVALMSCYLETCLYSHIFVKDPLTETGVGVLKQ